MTEQLLSTLNERFFVTGGSLPEDAPSYVPRSADIDLYQALAHGEYCYVLDSRQVGKSSLMVRVAGQLRNRGYRVAALDLSAGGHNVTVEQWYFGLLYRLGCRLDLDTEFEDFWTKRTVLGPVERFMAAIREVALNRCDGQIVIFLDEIDSVRSLPFSADELFAAIREAFNRRGQDDVLNRLTFCLLGVATPADLIRDHRTTPFNIAQRIEIADFTQQDASLLVNGLYHPAAPERDNGLLLRRALYWTGGHPYLTQRLCRAIADDASATGPEDVDRVCGRVFLSRCALDTDDNLAFVRARVLGGGPDCDTAAALSLYATVRKSPHPVRFEAADPRVNVLRLAGVVRVTDGAMSVRCPIYARTFDAGWIAAVMPDAEARRQRAAVRRGIARASAVWLAVLFLLAIAAWQTWLARRSAQSATVASRRAGLLQAEKRRLATSIADLSLRQQHLQLQNATVARRLTLARTVYRQTLARRALVERLLSKSESRAAAEQRLVQAGYQRIAEMSGGIASAFAVKYETNAQALRYGIRAVTNGAGTGTLRQAAIDGLVDAVNAGVCRRLVLRHPEGVISATFSPDGSRILTAAKGRYCYLWNARSGAILSRFAAQQYPTHRQYINTAEFSPDGRTILTCSDEGGTALWRLTGDHVSPKPVWRLPPEPGIAVSCAAFDDTGRWVACAAAGNCIRVIDARTGIGRTLTPPPSARHSRYLWTVAFSHDGRELVSAGADGSVRVWDSTSGELRAVSTLKTPDPRPAEYPGALAARFLQGDEHVVWSGPDGAAHVWDWRRGSEPRLLQGHKGWVWNSYEGRSGELIATAGADQRVIVWTMGSQPIATHEISGHKGQVFMARFSADGRELVTASDDKTAQVWVLTARTRTLRSGITDLAVSNGHDSMAIVTNTEYLCRYSLPDLAQNVLVKTDRPQRCVTVSPTHDMLATADNDGNVSAWCPVSRHGTAIRRWRANFASGPIEKVVYSPDGRRLASAGPKGWAVVYDSASGKPIRGLGWTFGQIADLCFSPDSCRLLVASKANTVHEWRIDNQLVLHAYDFPNMRPEYEGWHVDALNSCTYSPDGTLVAVSADDQHVYVWRTATERLATVLEGHMAAVVSAEFSPDGRALVTASADGTARIWDVAACASAWSSHRPTHPAITLRAGAAGLVRAHFFREGKAVVTADNNGTLRTWPATVPEYLRSARSLLASLALSETSSAGGATPASGKVVRNVRRWSEDIGYGSPMKTLIQAAYVRFGGRKQVGVPASIPTMEHETAVQHFFGGAGFQGDIVCWRMKTGTISYWIHGTTWRYWIGLGGLQSWLGRPFSGHELGGGRYVTYFERGRMYAEQGWRNNYSMPPHIAREYDRSGGFAVLGFPIESEGPDAQSQRFEHGTIRAKP